MKIKLDSKDVLEIAKSLKNGWLDVSKIATFQRLVRGYNPQKTITDKELNFYIDSLKEGWGYTPTDSKKIQSTLTNELPDELKEEWQEQIQDGTIYRNLIKDAFFGLVAIKGLGGTFTNQAGDFSFMENPEISQ